MIAKELLKSLDIVVDIVGFCAVDDIKLFIMMVRMSIQKIIIKI